MLRVGELCLRGGSLRQLTSRRPVGSSQPPSRWVERKRTKIIHLNDVLKAEIVNIRLRERNIKPNSENT